MFSTADKVTKNVSTVQRQSAQPFFARKNADPFFAGSEKTSSPSSSFIQPKLSVSHPDDPQEKEADQMAHKVMTMPESAPVAAAPAEQKDEVHRKEGEEQEVQRSAEGKEEKEVHRMEAPAVQLKEENEEVQRAEEEKEVSRQEEKEEKSVQRAAEKQEEKVQTKLFAGTINRSSQAFVQAKCDSCEEKKKVDRKIHSLPSSYTVQRSARGPPEGNGQQGSFESNLQSSRGLGSPLPGDTRSFMESRFSADFSGVRVHTNETSVQMNMEINAQAFTHGNDIYFNSGKFSPSSHEGKSLLAHELTHTIQQGASSHTSSPATNSAGASSVSTKLISRKKSIQRSAGNLATAVANAKGEQGKVIANKDGADGLRFGWQQLMEYFKTTLGAEKIVPDSSAGADPTTVAEGNIKKKNIAKGMNVIAPDGKVVVGERDAMPSWCGIFAFWALNKAGLPMKKWLLGNMTIEPGAALAPGVSPQPGFIAYRNMRSHYGLVSSVSGTKITTVNGNTAGADNLGGEIQEQTHDISNWSAFIDPMKLTTGAVRNPGAGVEGKPKSLREMQKEMFGVQRKEDQRRDDTHAENEGKDNEGKEKEGIEVQPKLQLARAADTAPATNTPADKKEEVQRKEEQGKEEEKTIHKKELIHTAAATSPNDKKEEVQRKEEHQEEEKNIHKKDAEQGPVAAHDKKEELQRKEEHPEEKAVQKKELIHAAADSSPPVHEEKVQPSAEHVARKEMVQRASGSSPPAADEKEKSTVQRKSEPKVQRLFGWVTDAIEWVGDKLEEGKKWLLGKVKDLIINVPGYKALRVVLGSDPISGETVERNGYNFIDAALDIMPGGFLLRKKLIELGILEQAAKFAENLFGRVETLISGIYDTFANFFNSLSLSDLKDIPGVFRRLENAFTSFFDEVINFAKGVAKDFLEFIKKALLIPLGTYIKTKTKYWDLLCIIIGKDPLTDEVKSPTGANILNAILGLSEWGLEQKKKMQETGTFNKVAAWIDKGIAVFGKAYDMLKAAFAGLWKIVSIEALMNPVETFLKIFDSFWQPIALVGKFFIDAGIAILKIVKDVLFKWISKKAQETKGFYLVTVLISKDPFTGESVPRTAQNLIKGFMLLSDGGEEQYNKMKESGAIDSAAAKIDAAVDELGFTWAYVKGLFTSLWEKLSWTDLIVPVMAFVKIIDTFKNPIIRLIRFIIQIVVALFEVILRMMGFPVDLVFKLIDNVKKAWAMIKANPTGFLLNLLKAIKQGFVQFFDNILTHLWNGLKAWLKQELEDGGVPMPQDYTVMGIIKWLLIILDITMEKIWKKLEARVGKEKVDKIRSLIAKAEAIYDKANEAMEFIEDVRKRGMEAIVDKIKEKLSNIWDMVLDVIKGFIMDQIIKKVTAKLLTMLDPTGVMAVINSAIALYKAIQSFIKYITKMLQIVNSFVEGIIEICTGNISSAANYLENALANGIPVAIGFLANQVGLDLSGKIRDVLASVREKVDKGLDFLIDKLVGFVEKLVAKAMQAKDKIMGWLGMKKTFTSAAGKNHSMYFKKSGDQANLIMESTPTTVESFLAKRKGEIPTDASLDAAKKADHLAKIAQAEQLVSSINTLTYPKDKKAEQDDKNEMDILAKSEALIELLKVLDPKGVAGVIPAPTFLPGFNGNKAMFMEARYLSGYSDPKDPSLPKPNYQEGEDASNYKGTLQGALTTLESLGVRAKWVAFHIVNDNYGGKATDSNLVPAQQEINKDYLNTFEVNLKSRLKNKETVWMKFNCQYRGTTPFLQSMSATGGGMKFENNQWVEDPAQKEQFSAKIDPPVATIVHVNTLKKDPVLYYFYTSETALDTKTLDFLAGEVAKGVKFTSVAEIQTAVVNFFKPKDNRLFNDVGKTTFSFV